MSIKEQVLEILELRRGDVISGQHLADDLQVSRAAVWKAIAALREEGHHIESATNRGYRLCEGADVLSAAGIRSTLQPAYRGYDIVVLDEVSSTNSYAIELALKGAGDGTLIVANRQTAGRGRRGRSFYSPAQDGVYMSIIFRSQNRPEQALLLTIMAGVAVCRTIEQLTEARPRIKWVNDIFIGDKKVCGILSEAVSDFESGSIAAVVVGIGVNLRVDGEQLPASLRPVIGAIASSQLTRNRLIGAVANELFALAANGEDSSLLAAYKERSLVLGRTIEFEQNGRLLQGVAEDINERGNLVVRLTGGEQIVLPAGEISICRL